MQDSHRRSVENSRLAGTTPRDWKSANRRCTILGSVAASEADWSKASRGFRQPGTTANRRLTSGRSRCYSAEKLGPDLRVRPFDLVLRPISRCGLGIRGSPGRAAGYRRHVSFLLCRRAEPSLHAGQAREASRRAAVGYVQGSGAGAKSCHDRSDSEVEPRLAGDGRTGVTGAGAFASGPRKAVCSRGLALPLPQRRV